MVESKLIQLLRSFSRPEWRAFIDFVRSPYFNKQKKLVLFCAHLKKLAYNGFPEEKLERETLFKAVFPDVPFDNKELNYVSNNLLQLAQTFIGLDRHAQNESMQTLDVLDSLLERDLVKHYSFESRSLEKKLEKSSLRDSGFHFFNYRYAGLKNRYFLQQKERRHDPQLEKMQEQLDRYYIAQKLRIACEMLDRQQFISHNYSISLLDEILSHLNLYPSLKKESPAIALYIELFQLLTAESSSSEHFIRYRSLLSRYREHFPLDEMRNLFLYAINFCLRQVRAGRTKYLSELFDLYQEGIESRLLFENDRLSPWTFKNVVKLGLRLKKYDWTHAFIESAVAHLEPSYRNDARHYNLAEWSYFTGKYGDAITLLTKSEFSDIYYVLDARVMLAKIYYETEEWDALESLLNAFRVYLNRNRQVPDGVKKLYLNFLNFLSQLLKSPNGKHPGLSAKVKSTTSLVERNWLLEKVGS
jgi:hypothetical protein